MTHRVGQKPTVPLPSGSGLRARNDTVLPIPDRELPGPPQMLQAGWELSTEAREVFFAVVSLNGGATRGKSHQEGPLSSPGCFGEVSDRASRTGPGKASRNSLSSHPHHLRDAPLANSAGGEVCFQLGLLKKVFFNSL